MAMLYSIPLQSGTAWFSQAITLQGTRYVLEFRWNDREQLWIMSILDAANNAIVMGIPMHAQRNLFGQYVGLSLPTGNMWVEDTTGQGTDPGLTSFQTTHALFYLDDKG